MTTEQAVPAGLLCDAPAVAQPAHGTSPANLHMTVTAAMARPESTAELLRELAAAVERASARTTQSLPAATQ